MEDTLLGTTDSVSQQPTTHNNANTVNMAELLERLNGSPIPEPVPETEELWEALRICEEIKNKWIGGENPVSQYEDEIRAVIQDKLHLTVDLQDKESRTKRLIAILSYYLRRECHPDVRWKKIISTIWQPVGHRRRPGYSMQSWFSLLSEILLDGGFIQTFQKDELFQLLRYYPKPVLCYSPSSYSDYGLYSELIEWFSTHVPFKLIHEFMRNKTDAQDSRTILFYAQDFSAYITMYRESPHELQQLLLMKDLNGDTALHHNSAIFSGSALCDVFGDDYGPLYVILSVQNTEKSTVLHTKPNLLWPFLLQIFSSEDKSALHNLILLKDMDGQTCLFKETTFSDHMRQLLLCAYKDNINNLFELFGVRDRRGKIVLHTKYTEILPVLKRFRETHYSIIQNLLCERDSEGRTVLFNVRDPVFFQNLYQSRWDAFLHLLSIYDLKKQSALHSNAWTVVRILDEKPYWSSDHFERMHKLFSAVDETGQTALFTAVRSSSFISLLHKLYNTKSDKLLQLLSINDRTGQTALHINSKLTAAILIIGFFSWNEIHQLLVIIDDQGQTALFTEQIQHIIPLLETKYQNQKGELYELLSIQDRERRTALHCNIDTIADLMLSMFDEETQRDSCQDLLAAQDHRGQTVMFKIKDMSKISKLFTNHMDSLHSLLSIQDNTGQTALYNNLRPFTQSLVETYTPDKLYREGLNKLLNIKDSSSQTALEMNEEKEPSSFCELSWLLRQVEHNTYPLKSPPQALIVYNEKNREGAKEEAQSLIDALSGKLFNVDVLKDELKIKIMAQIVSMAKKTEKQSALVVVIMSHGSATAIADSDGEPIEYAEVEGVMCKYVKSFYNPKILIIQACQGGSNDSADSPMMAPEEISNTQTDPGQNHPEVPAARCYEPTHRNFYAVLSTTSGKPSERKVFIPKLARQIKNSEEFDTLDGLVMNVTDEMENDGYQQTPVHISICGHRICPGSVFDPSVDNKDKRKRNPPEDEIEMLKEKIRRLESDL